jgi:non-ribosomal peptide synthetase component E (peptide arylation enzyme)
VRGNIVMQGYFQDPDATARAFGGGHFHSGDLAVWHPDGSVQIQDRIKDIIISGGEVSCLRAPPSRLQSLLTQRKSMVRWIVWSFHLELVVARHRTR